MKCFKCGEEVTGKFCTTCGQLLQQYPQEMSLPSAKPINQFKNQPIQPPAQPAAMPVRPTAQPSQSFISPVMTPQSHNNAVNVHTATSNKRRFDINLFTVSALLVAVLIGFGIGFFVSRISLRNNDNHSTLVSNYDTVQEENFIVIT